MRSWDEGIPYEKLRARIQNLIKENQNKTDLWSITRLAYGLVYAIQLRNALRIGEAVEAYYKYINKEYEKRNGHYVVVVQVEKKKEPTYREVIFPSWIPWTVVSWLRRFRVDVDVKKACVYCRRWLGVNTHSLRYARITYLLDNGINPAIVAKITKHSKIDFILKYTQEKIAEKVNYSFD